MISACLRPHEKVHLQTAGTRSHNYMILSYNLVSVGLCLLLYKKIESEDKRLAKTLKFKVIVDYQFWLKVVQKLSLIFRLLENQETCTQLEWAWQMLL